MEVPQNQYLGRTVDAPVAVRRQASPWRHGASSPGDATPWSSDVATPDYQDQGDSENLELDVSAAR